MIERQDRRTGRAGRRAHERVRRAVWNLEDPRTGPADPDHKRYTPTVL